MTTFESAERRLMMRHTPSPTSVMIEVDIRNVYNGSDLAGFEKHLSTLPGITGVHLDRTAGVAHLSYNPDKTTPETLEKELWHFGYKCDCRSRHRFCPEQSHDHALRETGVENHSAHHTHDSHDATAPASSTLTPHKNAEHGSPVAQEPPNPMLSASTAQ